MRDRTSHNREWTPADAEAIAAAQASGRSAADIASDYGVSRNAILGVILRWRRAQGIPATPRPDANPKVPREPRPPRLVLRRKRPAKAKAFECASSPCIQVLPYRVPNINVLRCEAMTLDGTLCKREAVHSSLCLGHVWIERGSDMRLRPPARRVASRAAMLGMIESMVPSVPDARGRLRPGGLAGLTAAYISSTLCDGRALRTVARRLGYERLDEVTYRQVTA